MGNSNTDSEKLEFIEELRAELKFHAIKLLECGLEKECYEAIYLKLGIKIEILAMEINIIFNEVKNHDFDLYDAAKIIAKFPNGKLWWDRMIKIF